MNFFNSLLCCCQQSNSQELLRNESTIEIQLQETIPLKIKPPSTPINIHNLQKNKQAFIDPDFPPNSRSLGQLLGITRQITWKRISEIASNYCVYDPKKNLSTTIIASSCTHNYITIGLLSLASIPSSIFDILGKNGVANKAGVYKLAVKYKGVYQWIMIDDYVPVFSDTGRPLICGLVNQQIWVMLICKMWAKLCGSYSAIDDGNLFEFISAFSPASCFLYMVSPSNYDKLKPEIQQSLRSFEYSICALTSRNTKKSLHSNEYYVARGCFEGGKQLCELIGVVNGQQVSVKVSLEQLFISCTQVIVSQRNNRFIIDQSQFFNLKYKYPLLLKINLEEPVSIILNFSREKKMNNEKQYFRAIVGKKINNDNYTYVNSKLEADYLNLFLDCGYLTQGQYLIFILLNGPKGQQTKITATSHRLLQGQFTVPRFIQLKAQNNLVYTFIKSIFIDYSKSSKTVIKRQIPKSGTIFSMQQRYQQGGFAYLVIKTFKNSPLKQQKIKINQRQIQMSKYELFGYREDIEFVIESGQQEALLFLLKESKESIIQDFPPGVSIVQVF